MFTYPEPPKLQRSDFSTSRLDGDERLPMWQESIGTLFDITAGTHYAPDAFDARLTSYLLNDQIMFSRCETRAQRFERSALRFARDDLDYYLVQTLERGTQRVTRAGKQKTLKPGQLLIIDLADAHDAVTSDFSNLSLVVPRPLLAPHLRHPDSHGSRIINPDEPLSALAVNHLTTLGAVVGNMSPAQGSQVIEPTLKLLASALNGSSDSVDGGTHGVAMSLLVRARFFIERNLQRELSVEQLCRELRLSRSSLYRLFEPLGGVRAYIQQRRLLRSAAELTHPGHQQKPIYQIAFQWGFHSESHFSRYFRRKFGVSPREARKAGTTRRTTAQETGNELIGDRDYEQWLSERLKG